MRNRSLYDLHLRQRQQPRSVGSILLAHTPAIIFAVALVIGCGFAMKHEADRARARHARGSVMTLDEIYRMRRSMREEERALIRARTEWYKNHTNPERPR